MYVVLKIPVLINEFYTVYRYEIVSFAQYEVMIGDFEVFHCADWEDCNLFLSMYLAGYQV